MIQTLIALLKFNLIMLIPSVICTLVITSRSMMEKLWPVVVALVIFTIFKNLQIIWKGRHRIFASVETAALDATASAIEFRQKVDARVVDRAKRRNLE